MVLCVKLLTQPSHKLSIMKNYLICQYLPKYVAFQQDTLLYNEYIVYFKVFNILRIFKHF